MKNKQLLFLLAAVCFFSTMGTCQKSTAEIIIAGVDPTTPPNGNNITYVEFDLDFKQVSAIKEDKMHLVVKIVQYTRWVDPRLAYANNTNVTDNFKNSRLDLSAYTNYIWTPKIGYTEQNEKILLG